MNTTIILVVVIIFIILLCLYAKYCETNKLKENLTISVTETKNGGTPSASNSRDNNRMFGRDNNRMFGNTDDKVPFGFGDMQHLDDNTPFFGGFSNMHMPFEDPTRRHSAPHAIAPHHTAVHNAISNHVASHHTAPHAIAPHHTAPHHTAPHAIAPHHTAPHAIAPHHTAPHHTILNHIAAPHAIASHHSKPAKTTSDSDCAVNNNCKSTLMDLFGSLTKSHKLSVDPKTPDDIAADTHASISNAVHSSAPTPAHSTSASVPSSSTNSAITTGSWNYVVAGKTDEVTIAKSGVNSYKVTRVTKDPNSHAWTYADIKYVSGNKYSITYHSTFGITGPFHLTVSNNGKTMTAVDDASSWNYISSSSSSTKPGPVSTPGETPLECFNKNKQYCSWGHWTDLKAACNLSTIPGQMGKDAGTADGAVAVNAFCKKYSNTAAQSTPASVPSSNTNPDSVVGSWNYVSGGKTYVSKVTKSGSQTYSVTPITAEGWWSSATMTHNSGNTYTTYFDSGTNLYTTLSSNGNTLSFSNGTSWSRSSPSSSGLKSITTAAECAAAGGVDFNYCPDTGKYYCCGVKSGNAAGYAVCSGTDGACPSNSNLQNCVCPSDLSSTPASVPSSSTNSTIVTGTWSYTEKNKKPQAVAIKKTGSKSYQVIPVGNDAADAWWNSAIINHVSGSKYQISYSTGVSTATGSGPIDITVSNNGKNMTSDIASWTYTSSRTFSSWTSTIPNISTGTWNISGGEKGKIEKSGNHSYTLGTSDGSVFAKINHSLGNIFMIQYNMTGDTEPIIVSSDGNKITFRAGSGVWNYDKPKPKPKPPNPGVVTRGWEWW